MQRYIERMISGRFFAHLDREEARSESNLELIQSIETWPGAGNFSGWFAAHFKNRALNIYSSRAPEEQPVSRRPHVCETFARAPKSQCLWAFQLIAPIRSVSPTPSKRGQKSPKTLAIANSDSPVFAALRRTIRRKSAAAPPQR
jgi:DNA-directed RNA polymerase specialized sigma24 family protein